MKSLTKSELIKTSFGRSTRIEFLRKIYVLNKVYSNKLYLRSRTVQMRITDKKYLSNFRDVLEMDIEEMLENNTSRQRDINLDFRIKTSAVYSANIEGNSVDINSYMNSEISKESFKPRKEIEEISDLIKAYQFAIEHKLNEVNLLEAHRLLSETILIRDKRGRYRTDRMGVYDNSGLVYLAVEPEKVNSETKIFFSDIETLLKENMDAIEIFYHASLIHLKFAQIHPFWDGNGRASRLLEKWFLAEKLGAKAWKIESEHFYKENIQHYYKNINLGMDYYSLNDEKCIPFLKMLADSLKNIG